MKDKKKCPYYSSCDNKCTHQYRFESKNKPTKLCIHNKPKNCKRYNEWLKLNISYEIGSNSLKTLYED